MAGADTSSAMDVDSTSVPQEQTQAEHPLKTKFEDAKEILSVNSAGAVTIFKQILDDDDSSEAAQKVKEQAIYKLSQIYAQEGRASELKTLLHDIRPFFATIPKAKTGKIVRTVIDMVSRCPDSQQLQIDLCQDCIAWANKEKHTFLRQRIQGKLCSLLLEKERYQEALEMINNLVREIKKLDDKQLLVEIHLTESRLHHALRNLPKAKAALTAARTAANAIYVVPKMQAQIDKMSGLLHCEEKDYKTGYSYFFEAFEVLSAFDDETTAALALPGQGSEGEALSCLKYMLLCKIMNDQASDVVPILNGKMGMKYTGPTVEAMTAVAKAAVKRSLEDFEESLEKFAPELKGDNLISHHLNELYENLLEANLMKIIEPFSCVEIQHVAKLISLPVKQIESKLSHMILDKKFHGILDQGKGQLIIYDEVPADKSYSTGLEVISNVDKVVDSLFRRADKLHS